MPTSATVSRSAGCWPLKNTVIPYAVGVDIACRMKMTVLDVPAPDLERHQDRLTRAIEAETRFGIGASFKHRRQHEVLDADWDVSPVTKQNQDRAWSQLGTSGRHWGLSPDCAWLQRVSGKRWLAEYEGTHNRPLRALVPRNPTMPSLRRKIRDPNSLLTAEEPRNTLAPRRI